MDEEKRWQLSSIIDHRIVPRSGGDMQVMVKWKPTWETLASLKRDYWQCSYKIDKRKKRKLGKRQLHRVVWDPTWEPFEDIKQDEPEALAKYLFKHPETLKQQVWDWARDTLRGKAKRSSLEDIHESEQESDVDLEESNDGTKEKHVADEKESQSEETKQDDSPKSETTVAAADTTEALEQKMSPDKDEIPTAVSTDKDAADDDRKKAATTEDAVEEEEELTANDEASTPEQADQVDRVSTPPQDDEAPTGARAIWGWAKKLITPGKEENEDKNEEIVGGVHYV